MPVKIDKREYLGINYRINIILVALVYKRFKYPYSYSAVFKIISANRVNGARRHRHFLVMS
jgi:hypothetical protein